MFLQDPNICTHLGHFTSPWGGTSEDREKGCIAYAHLQYSHWLNSQVSWVPPHHWIIYLDEGGRLEGRCCCRLHCTGWKNRIWYRKLPASQGAGRIWRHQYCPVPQDGCSLCSPERLIFVLWGVTVNARIRGDKGKDQEPRSWVPPNHTETIIHRDNSTDHILNLPKTNSRLAPSVLPLADPVTRPLHTLSPCTMLQPHPDQHLFSPAGLLSTLCPSHHTWLPGLCFSLLPTSL